MVLKWKIKFHIMVSVRDIDNNIWRERYSILILCNNSYFCHVFRSRASLK